MVLFRSYFIKIDFAIALNLSHNSFLVKGQLDFENLQFGTNPV